MGHNRVYAGLHIGAPSWRRVRAPRCTCTCADAYVLTAARILYCLNRAVLVPVFRVPKTKQTTGHFPRGLESLPIE